MIIFRLIFDFYMLHFIHFMFKANLLRFALHGSPVRFAPGHRADLALLHPLFTSDSSEISIAQIVA